MTTNTLASLAQAVHATSYADFSPATIHKMKIHLLDTLGVSLAGAHASETARVIAGLGITTDTMGTTHIWGTPYIAMPARRRLSMGWRPTPTN